MSDAPSNPSAKDSPGPEDRLSAVFAGLISQQANMALMFLGQVPNPETGQAIQDLDAARMFIDQMEMMEVKTRGNLTAEEAKWLKQSLTAVRLAFVKTVDSQVGRPGAGTAAPRPPEAGGTAEPGAAAAPTATPDEESRKKFTKKY
jgi:hypothetical protein